MLSIAGEGHQKFLVLFLLSHKSSAVEAEERVEKQQIVGQWWISVLVAFSVISILVAIIVTTNFTRMMRMKMHT